MIGSLNFGTFSFSKENQRPWASEPIVCASFACSEHTNINEGIELTSFVYPPKNEYELLRRLCQLFETKDCTRIWFYGYGEDTFDLPYLLSRSRCHGLEGRIKKAITRIPNIDLYTSAKSYLRIPPNRHLTIEECAQRLGLQTNDVGSSFKDMFNNWLEKSDPKAIWSTELLSLLCLRLTKLDQILQINR